MKTKKTNLEDGAYRGCIFTLRYISLIQSGIRAADKQAKLNFPWRSKFPVKIILGDRSLQISMSPELQTFLHNLFEDTENLSILEKSFKMRICSNCS